MLTKDKVSTFTAFRVRLKKWRFLHAKRGNFLVKKLYPYLLGEQILKFWHNFLSEVHEKHPNTDKYSLANTRFSLIEISLTFGDVGPRKPISSFLPTFLNLAPDSVFRLGSSFLSSNRFHYHSNNFFPNNKTSFSRKYFYWPIWASVASLIKREFSTKKTKGNGWTFFHNAIIK